MTGVVGPSNGLLLESEALDQEVYQKAVGGHLEVSVVKGRDKVTLLPGAPGTAQARRASRSSSESRRRVPAPAAPKAAKS